jgi:copper(I)-binding protein
MRRSKNIVKRSLGLLALLLAAVPSFAQVTVSAPWVRATVVGQQVTGAFLQLTAASDMELVAASSPAAARVEIHEMAMEENVMRMRAVPSVALPAGRPVALEPGGYHLMLLDLHAPVRAGDTVPLTLVLEGKDGKRSTVKVDATARPLGTR